MKKSKVDILLYIMIFIYAFIMLDVVFRFDLIFTLDRSFMRSYNLVPTYSVLNYLSGKTSASPYLIALNILGNILVFIPCGLYINLLQNKHKVIKSLLVVMLISIAIELIQFVFALGVCDIDDVLLNFIGGLMGVLGCQIISKITGSYHNTKKAVAVVSSIFGLPLVALYIIPVVYNR